MEKTFKLCYVETPFAYFTTARLSEQWGDDWDDAPYEHNAERPYTDKGEIITVAYTGELLTPADGHSNSPYSVKEINSGGIAWLRSPKWSAAQVVIFAGATLGEFVAKVRSTGGEVYLPYKYLKKLTEEDIRSCLTASYETDYVWDGVDERKVKHFDIDLAVKLIMEILYGYNRNN